MLEVRAAKLSAVMAAASAACSHQACCQSSSVISYTTRVAMLADLKLGGVHHRLAPQCVMLKCALQLKMVRTVEAG